MGVAIHTGLQCAHDALGAAAHEEAAFAAIWAAGRTIPLDLAIAEGIAPGIRGSALGGRDGLP